MLELNGVSAEATHIYDPKTSLFAAYRTLFTQWRLAFAIGAANRARGHRPLRLREVIALLGHRRRAFGGVVHGAVLGWVRTTRYAGVNER